MIISTIFLSLLRQTIFRSVGKSSSMFSPLSSKLLHAYLTIDIWNFISQVPRIKLIVKLLNKFLFVASTSPSFHFLFFRLYQSEPVYRSGLFSSTVGIQLCIYYNIAYQPVVTDFHLSMFTRQLMVKVLF